MNFLGFSLVLEPERETVLLLFLTLSKQAVFSYFCKFPFQGLKWKIINFIQLFILFLLFFT